MYDFEAIRQVGTLAEAIEALAADPSATVIAGGSDVLIKLREGKLPGCRLIGIRNIPELYGVSRDGEGTIHIGPLTTFTQITRDPLIRKYLPVLGDAVDQVGGPQIRNVGTIGGNVCNGVTSADSASTLFALNALLTLTGPEGKRRVPIAEFYVSAGKVALRPGELLTDIAVRQEDYRDLYGCYVKYAMRSAMDIATLGCCVCCRLEGDVLADLRVAFGVAGPVPMRCRKTEELLRGRRLDAALLRDLGESAAGEVNPRTSWRASREFRLQLATELPRRALTQAVSAAGGVFHE